MLLHRLTLLSLFLHIFSLAAAQTAYGQDFLTLRWISLFGLTGFATAAWATGPRVGMSLPGVDNRVVAYLALWGLTVMAGAYPAFSAYRFAAHAMIVASSLVFLPRLLRLTDGPRLLWALKVLVSVILIVSYLRPARLTALDDPSLFRGIFGNPNAFGHMAAVGTLLFFHGYLTRRDNRSGYVQLALAGLAVVLMARSGARSSAAGCAAGFLTLTVLYRARMSRYLIVGAAAPLVLMVAFPNMIVGLRQFILKDRANDQQTDLIQRLTATRQDLWKSSLDGFRQRPVLGWGFGVDSDIDLSGWDGQLTALGFTGRDPVNDFTYTLETGGIVGFGAYLFMISALPYSLRPPRVLKRARNAPSRSHMQALNAYEVQRAFFSLSVLLIVLFEFDDTALSAGNFFAALLWVSMGATAALKALLWKPIRAPKVPHAYPASAAYLR